MSTEKKGQIEMKKITQRLLAFLLLFVMVFSMTACGGNQDSTDENNDNQTQEQMKDGQTIYPCNVTSADGSTVTLEKEPEKIVSVSPTLSEMLFALDAGEKLIGRSDYCDYPAEILEVESMGSIQTPDMEKIIAAAPDLVLVSGMMAEEYMTKLTSVGVPVLLVEEVGKFEEVYDVMTLMGLVLNRNEKAEACISEMKATVAEVEEKIAGLETPSVYYVVGYGEYGDFTAGGDTFAGDILSLAGGDNIAKDISGWSINLEDIIESDPDIIIMPEYYKEGFVATPHYSDLTAVKEGRVYTLDNNMIDRQGYRNAEAIRTLAEIFHPEAFK